MNLARTISEEFLDHTRNLRAAWATNFFFFFFFVVELLSRVWEAESNPIEWTQKHSTTKKKSERKKKRIGRACQAKISIKFANCTQTRRRRRRENLERAPFRLSHTHKTQTNKQTNGLEVQIGLCTNFSLAAAFKSCLNLSMNNSNCRLSTSSFHHFRA